MVFFHSYVSLPEGICFFGGGLEDVEMMNGIGFEQPNHSTSFGIGASGPGTTHSTRERGNM